METRRGRVRCRVPGCLETFLVEWKPPCTPRALLCRMVLETFLVEWKQKEMESIGGKGYALKPS